MKFWIPFVALVPLVAGVTVAHAQKPAPPTDLSGARRSLSVAVARFERDFDLVAARKEADRITQTTPQLGAAWIWKASLAEADDRWSEAVNAYTTFLEKNPQSPLAAQVKESLDAARVEAAVDPATRARRQSEAAMERVRRYLSLGDTRAASLACVEASRKDPDAWEPYVAFAALLARSENYGKAADALNEAATRLEKRFPGAEAEADKKKTVRALQAAYAAEAQKRQSRRDGDAALLAKDYARAAAAYAEAWHQIPGPSGVDNALRAAAAYHKTGDNPKALALLDEAEAALKEIKETTGGKTTLLSIAALRAEVNRK